jgi:hypothetical protein
MVDRLISSSRDFDVEGKILAVQWKIRETPKLTVNRLSLNFGKAKLAEGKRARQKRKNSVNFATNA